MLAYLEDLQQNNPSEYELLVQQMQSQRQAAGGAASAAGGATSESEQVFPSPGFVAKTVSATNKGQKVFINVCQSAHVDAPSPVQGKADAEEVQYRIPMSLGPPREDLDKDGAVCTVYDVVFHPDAIENSLAQAEFRQFVMSLTLHQIESKYKDELSSDIKFPKIKGNYKGVAPLPQFMRKKGSSPMEAQTSDSTPSAKQVGPSAPLTHPPSAFSCALLSISFGHRSPLPLPQRYKRSWQRRLPHSCCPPQRTRSTPSACVRAPLQAQPSTKARRMA